MTSPRILLLFLAPFVNTLSVVEERDVFEEKLKTLLQRVSAPDNFKSIKERCFDSEAKDMTDDCSLFKYIVKLQKTEPTSTTTESGTDLLKSSQLGEIKVGSIFPIRTIQIPKPKIPVTSIHKPIVKYCTHGSKTVVTTEIPQDTVVPTVPTPAVPTGSPLVKLLIDGERIQHIQLEIFGLSKAEGFQIVPISKELAENRP